MKGYKGFDESMKCKGYQYEEGGTYKHKGDIAVCESGFHFCENPLDILDYYDLCDSTFAEIEATGKVVGHTGDSKHATTEITVSAKLDLAGFVKAAVDFLLLKINGKKTAASGDSSQLAASGDSSQLELNGRDSVGAAIGSNGKIKGKTGCWITLAEYDGNGKIKYVKSAKIDGKKIKADTWYRLKNGKFVSV